MPSGITMVCLTSIQQQKINFLSCLGVEIALYFSWLGFLNYALVPPAIAGIFVFFYGIHLIGTDVPQNVSLVLENCWSSSCSALNSPELFVSLLTLSYFRIYAQPWTPQWCVLTAISAGSGSWVLPAAWLSSGPILKSESQGMIYKDEYTLGFWLITIAQWLLQFSSVSGQFSLSSSGEDTAPSSHTGQC